MKTFTTTKRTGALIGVIFFAAAISAYLVAGTQFASASRSAHTVLLTSDHAQPSAIAVKVGEYVEFDAKDNEKHNIGQGKGDDEVHQAAHQDEHEHTPEGKESGDFGPGQGYRVQFSKPGTYDFHDHLHPKISVTVIVYNSK